MGTKKGLRRALPLVSQSHVRYSRHRQKTLIDKIDQLLDAGYLQVAGMEMGSHISHQRIYRVTHPNVLSTRKWVIEMLPEKPSITAKKIGEYMKRGGSKITHDSETSELNIYSSEL